MHDPFRCHSDARGLPRGFAIGLILVLALSGCTPAATSPGAQAESGVTATSTTGATPAAPATAVTSPATAVLMQALTSAPAPTAAQSAAPPTASSPTASGTPAVTTGRPEAAGQGTSTPTAPPVQPGIPSGVSLRLIAEGLTAPVALVPAPDGSGRLFVVDQSGVIWIIGQDGALMPTPFLDLRDRVVQLSPNYDERGLLGLAFHPDFAKNRRFFVYYSAPLRPGGPAGYDNTEHLSEFSVSQPGANQADAGSERLLLAVDHPQANHDGGTLAFGPDGYLYLSIGDGGGANDSGAGHTPGLGNGQDKTRLLGKILRIDVNSGSPYGIPKDNPFAGGGGAAEIYAYGLRNVYRFSFDAGGTHQLFAADVGQNLFEEVDIVTRGGNYGWNLKEGFHCFSPASPPQPPATCPQSGAAGEPLIDPILEYSHPDPGIAIIGGFIYRGAALPALAGQYIFGDWSSSFGAPDGVLLVARPPSGGQSRWPFRTLAVAGAGGSRFGHFLLGLGQDASGELYALTSDRAGPVGTSGRVYKLEPGQ